MKLTVRLSGKVIDRREFDDDQSKVVIGRSSSSDVVIDNVGVSRAHCEIARDGHAHVVRDLQSNNGTYVNGKRIWTHNLNDGDEIQVGKFKIAYEAAAPPPPPPPPLESADTPRRLQGDFTMPMEALRPELLKGPANRIKGYLLVKGVKGPGATALLEKAIFVIGTGERADLRISGIFLGRKHALIVRDEIGFILVDTSGKYRTLVNESPCDQERLHGGDVIRIGRHELTFQVGTPDY